MLEDVPRDPFADDPNDPVTAMGELDDAQPLTAAERDVAITDLAVLVKFAMETGRRLDARVFRDLKKRLIEKQVPVTVKLRNNEMVKGVIEYYDTHFIRITRPAAPNLFIFKHEIKYIFEEPRA